MDWLSRAAARRPDRVAIETADGALTYAELLQRAKAQSERLATGRVPIEHPPGLDFAVALHAALLAGASAMPVDPRLAPAEREGLLATAGRPAPAGLLVHTSGTTGTPRPVEITLAQIEANALGSAIALGLDPDERWLCPLPLSHVGGLMVLLRSAIYATTAVIDRYDRADVTLASMVPTQLQRLLDAGSQPGPRLRTILLGGAPAPTSLLQRAKDAGWPVSPTYGLTQACSQVTVAEPGDVDTSGFAIHGTTLTIAPDGEIVVDGRLYTGDLGRLDARGRLIVIGRKSDTIVTGGENVAPTEVEAVLLQHPAVQDAGVFARPHPEWGEAVTASVVLTEPTDPEELERFAAERLARYKVPKAFEITAQLPRTPSGKLLRRELR
jgi:o-succinylbenzoate---CoA ligase